MTRRHGSDADRTAAHLYCLMPCRMWSFARTFTLPKLPFLHQHTHTPTATHCILRLHRPSYRAVTPSSYHPIHLQPTGVGIVPTSTIPAIAVCDLVSACHIRDAHVGIFICVKQTYTLSWPGNRWWWWWFELKALDALSHHTCASSVCVRLHKHALGLCAYHGEQSKQNGGRGSENGGNEGYRQSGCNEHPTCGGRQISRHF